MCGHVDKTKVPEAELRIAEEKMEETTEICRNGMENLRESDVLPLLLPPPPPPPPP